MWGHGTRVCQVTFWGGWTEGDIVQGSVFLFLTTFAEASLFHPVGLDCMLNTRSGYCPGDTVPPLVLDFQTSVFTTGLGLLLQEISCVQSTRYMVYSQYISSPQM